MGEMGECEKKTPSELSARSHAISAPVCALWLTHVGGSPALSPSALGIALSPPTSANSTTAGSAASPFKSPMRMTGAFRLRASSPSLRPWCLRMRRSWVPECGNVRCVCSSVRGRPHTLSSTSCTMQKNEKRELNSEMWGKGVCDIWEKWVSGWRNQIR